MHFLNAEAFFSITFLVSFAFKVALKKLHKVQFHVSLWFVAKKSRKHSKTHLKQIYTQKKFLICEISEICELSPKTVAFEAKRRIFV